MYYISVADHFDAAHFLRGYQGKCEALHGHRFQIVAKVCTSKLDDVGIAYDFTRLKRHLKSILSRFDHTCLNDIPPFDSINPSSENIAATIFASLKSEMGEAPVTLCGVEVWESPQSRVSYQPD